MRFIAVGFGIAAVLATTVASASGGTGGKGDTGDKGGLGPGSEPTPSPGTSDVNATDLTTQAIGGKSTQNPDVSGNKKVEEKPWEIAAYFETHRLIRQDYNDDGDGAFKVFNVLFATAKYAFTDYDTAIISGGVNQYFLSDSGESGFRGNDISLAYTHMFNLPEKFKLRTSVGATIPISYYSQIATNITTPSVNVSLSRKFGDLAVQAGLRGVYFWDRYTSQNYIGASADGDTSGSGLPNAHYSFGGSISAEYDMPFYRPLSAGLALTDSYIKYYDVGTCPPDSGVGTPDGLGPNGCQATTNPITDNNPIQQSYGGEIFVRYVMPDLSGFKSDLTIALANGDPSLGYTSVLHDGIVHPYLLYYQQAEVYAALSGRY